MRIIKMLALFIVVALTLSVTGCGKDSSSGSQSPVKKEEETKDNVDVSSLSTTFANEKDETVNAKADATGKVMSLTASELLTGIEGDELIKDCSELDEIMNTDGDEDYYEQNDNVIVWENNGEDIAYEGKLDNKKLPVGVKISYKLDGKEVDPKSIVGQSGKLEIRFDYINDTKVKLKVKGKEIESIVPFVAISMVPLDKDKFKHVEVENGKVMKMSDSTLAVGFCLPKVKESLKLKDWEVTKDIELDDYMVVKADVNDFSIDYTSTIFTNGLLKDMEEDSIDDGDDMKEGMDDLGDASNELVDGTSELYDGAGDFGSYLRQYVNGASQLSKGAKQLSKGAKTLDSKGNDLYKGSKAITDGLSKIDTSLAAIDLSNDKGDSDMPDVSKVLTELGGDSKDLKEALNALSKEIEEKTGKSNSFDTSKVDKAILGISNDVKSLSSFSEAMSKQASAMAGIGEQLNSLKEGISSLHAGSKSLTSGIKAYTKGVSAVSKGSKQISKGSATLASTGRTLNKGYKTMLEGIGGLKNGFRTFNDDGISELTKIAGSDMANTLMQVRALREADLRYKSFTKSLDEQDGSVKFIIETEEVK